jgi:uncharacterized protein YdaU (DUF1376 family)
MHGVSMTYAKFFPSDWRSGCLVLNLEEEGLYIRCCAFMYDTGSAIPGDDFAAARLLSVQVQKYQKVMRALIDKGKMIRAQGYIINERVQEEWTRYLVQREAREEAARKREATLKKKAEEIEKAILEKRAREATPPQVPPHQPPPGPLGGATGGTPLGLDELVNEINEEEAQDNHKSPCNPESRSHISKKRSSKEDHVADATPTPQDALEAFEAYNVTAAKCGLPLARTMTPQRRKGLIARMRDHGGTEVWRTALDNVERSAFLRGNNPRNWKADLDFMLQPKSFTRLVEGGYGNGAHASDDPEETHQQKLRRLMAQAATEENRRGE